MTAAALVVSFVVLLVVIVLSALRSGDGDFAAAPSRTAMPTASFSADSSRSLSASPAPGSAGPTAAQTPTPHRTAVPSRVDVSFPIRGNANSVLMTSGPNGGVYVAVPGDDLVVLALVKADGSVSAAWPIGLPTTWCTELLTAADGTLRAVCDGPGEGDGLQAPVLRIFGLDAAGRALPGWPLDIEGSPYLYGAPVARITGVDMAIALRQYGGDTMPEGETEPAQLALIDSSGDVQMGKAVDVECCQGGAAPGPASGFIVETDHAARTSRITKFGLGGVVWETTLDGIASLPSFDDAGNAYLSAWLGQRLDSARLVVLDPSGRVVRESPDDLSVFPTSGWNGAGGESPAAPIVAGDGSAFVVGDDDGMSILALNRQGRPRVGWPFHSRFGIEQQGFCPSTDTGCGTFDVRPQIGLDGTLYVATEPAKAGGGSLLAIRPDGAEPAGWPVGLRRGGAGFWNVMVGSDGGVWALAAEPERVETYSATLLSIDPESTVRGRLTIVEP